MKGAAQRTRRRRSSALRDADRHAGKRQRHDRQRGSGGEQYDVGKTRSTNQHDTATGDSGSVWDSRGTTENLVARRAAQPTCIQGRQNWSGGPRSRVPTEVQRAGRGGGDPLESRTRHGWSGGRLLGIDDRVSLGDGSATDGHPPFPTPNHSVGNAGLVGGCPPQPSEVGQPRSYGRLFVVGPGR